MCFYETLRHEPPVPLSSTTTVTDDIDLTGVKVRAGDRIILNLHQIHHNPDDWQEPDRFIPERFDPASKYRLKPDGTPRPPLAYIPFFGGKRVCLGKTFAETTFRFVFPLLMNAFEYEFENPE